MNYGPDNGPDKRSVWTQVQGLKPLLILVAIVIVAFLVYVYLAR